MLARWFLDVSFHATLLAFAAASLQPLRVAHCFKTLGSNRFDGLLACWVFVVWVVFYQIPSLKYALTRWLMDAVYSAFLKRILDFQYSYLPFDI